MCTQVDAGLRTRITELRSVPDCVGNPGDGHWGFETKGTDWRQSVWNSQPFFKTSCCCQASEGSSFQFYIERRRLGRCRCAIATINGEKQKREEKSDKHHVGQVMDVEKDRTATPHSTHTLLEKKKVHVQGVVR